MDDRVKASQESKTWAWGCAGTGCPEGRSTTMDSAGGVAEEGDTVIWNGTHRALSAQAVDQQKEGG